eukprot:gnl/MRDRNA2_/MRDRNA2_32272_c0_seq1.p1 gnl/MRDRNA2_/MRDRNA2_32272_c0~~gnl/MRDRNA2_/MRDRNA2_32272_c0_seq1.p1  ORF type:complete len:294 (+),score=42.56 gnl/MRDRNA2_/MRDRNA2_32272_c0_seq1:217-1098(+)
MSNHAFVHSPMRVTCLLSFLALRTICMLAVLGLVTSDMLDQSHNPATERHVFERFDAMHCDVSLPGKDLEQVDPEMFEHLRGRSMSRLVAYFNIFSYLRKLDQTELQGNVLDVSGSRPFLEWFDISRVHVRTLQYPNEDVHSMPHFGSGSFDWVMLDQVLEHLRNPWMAAMEIRRVLRPGGRVLLSTVGAYPIHGVQHHGGDYFRYTPAGLRMILASAGYANIELCGGWGTPNLTSTVLHATARGVPIKRMVPVELRKQLETVRRAGEKATWLSDGAFPMTVWAVASTSKTIS